MSALQHPSQILKSSETIIKVGALTGGDRPNITVGNSAGALTLPTGTLPTMKFLGGVTNASVAFNDGEQEYYVLGGGGFADSVKTTQRVVASVTSYMQKDFDTALQTDALDEAMTLVTKSRQDMNAEVYVQIFKRYGTDKYDCINFVAAVVNYSESYPADNLIEVTFDLASRGVVGMGTLTDSSQIYPTNQGADHQS